MCLLSPLSSFILFSSMISFFFNDTAPTEIYTLSLHDALPIFERLRLVDVITEPRARMAAKGQELPALYHPRRSEEHTSELQSLRHLVCRLLLEKKKTKRKTKKSTQTHNTTTT